MRKRCTRQHFIEYLSYNYIEKQALLARCTWQKYLHDYSYDGFLETYNENGEREYGKIDIQAKATDVIDKYRKANKLVYDIDKRDLESWVMGRFPVIFVLYDAQLDIGYYVDILAYFENRTLAIKKINKFVRIFIPVENLFNKKAVLELRENKNSVL